VHALRGIDLHIDPGESVVVFPSVELRLG